MKWGEDGNIQYFMVYCWPALRTPRGQTASDLNMKEPCSDLELFSSFLHPSLLLSSSLFTLLSPLFTLHSPVPLSSLHSFYAIPLPFFLMHYKFKWLESKHEIIKKKKVKLQHLNILSRQISVSPTGAQRPVLCCASAFRPRGSTKSLKFD